MTPLPLYFIPQWDMNVKRTSTILTIPTLLHRGAAEPLGLFGGRLTLKARLLAIFRSCCTTDQCLCAGHSLTLWPYNLMSLFALGGEELTRRSLTGS